MANTQFVPLIPTTDVAAFIRNCKEKNKKEEKLECKNIVATFPWKEPTKCKRHYMVIIMSF